MAERRAGGCSPDLSLPPGPRHSVRLHHCPRPHCGEGRSGGTVLETVAQRLVEDNESLTSEKERQSFNVTSNVTITSSILRCKEFHEYNE